MLSKIIHKIGSMDSRKRNTYLFAAEGAMGAVILNLINPFISMFAKRMGAGDFHIGLLSSLPALVGILALIPGALLVDRYNDKKKIVGLLIIATGLLYPMAALTPYLGKFSVPVYILIIAAINWPFSVFNISWQSFFSDVFNGSRSNSAYALRSAVSTFLGVMTALAAGLVLSYLPGTDGQRILIYKIFFITAFLLSLIQSWFLLRIRNYSLPERSTSSSSIKTALAGLKKLKGNKPFRNFIFIAFCFHISWQMAWPLFFIFQVDYLHANEAWLSYISVANGLAGVLTFPFWSKIIEKKGSRFAVIFGAVGLALNPLLTVISPNLFVVLLINIINGLTFSAFQLGLFENLMEVVPKENKTLNIALYTTLISVSGFLSPMLGVWIYKMTSIHFTMILSTVLRLAGAGLFYMRYRQTMAANRTEAAQTTAL